MDKDYYNRLAELAVNNDEAFTELYEKYFPPVYGMIFARLKDITAADDSLLNVMASVLHPFGDALQGKLGTLQPEINKVGVVAFLTGTLNESMI